MKKLIFTLTTALPLLAAAQGNKYQIRGKLAVPDNTTVLLFYTGEEKFEMDSTKVLKGSFSFTGTYDESRMASVSVKSDNAENTNVCTVYLEESPITITAKDNLATAIIKGGKANEVYRVWEKQQGANVQKKDSAAIAAFVAKYPGSPVSLDLVIQNETRSDRYWNLFQQLTPEVRGLKRGQTYANEVAKFRALRPGLIAPDFAAQDPEGKTIRLSDLRGKYVFIDFWASWCKPCRAAHPYLQSVYEKYKDKGFTILGVALDYKKEAWVKAIADDHVSWQQVSELKGFQGEIPKLYQVGAIPFGILIDPQGKIIDSKGRGVDKTLAELLGN